MSKRMVTMVVAMVATMFLAGPAFAGEWVWDNDAGDREWGNPVNWDQGTVPGSGASDRAHPIAGVPSPILGPGDTHSVGRVEVKATEADGFEIAGGDLSVVDFVYIRQNGHMTLSSGSLSINSANNPTMFIGEGAGGTFEMTGGTFTTNRWVEVSGVYVSPNATGTWLMADGQANIGTDLILAGGWNSGGTGILDMTGGTINARDINLASNADATAEVYLQGGTLNVRDVLWGSGAITLDIALGGTLIDRGDATNEAYLNDITYSITKGDGMGSPSVVYDEEDGVTYIRSVPEPATIGLLAMGGLALIRRRR